MMRTAFFLILVGGCVGACNLGAQPAANGSGRGDVRGSGDGAAGGTQVSGVVTSGVSGQPLADAGVTLTDVKDGKEAAETATDAEGRFAFAHVPDGQFALRASHRGFVPAAFEEHGGFSTAIVTGAGLDATGLNFTLEPQAAIYGTVTEDSGDPVPQARVSLYRKVGGTGRIVRAGMVGADAMGRFELPHMRAGSYYLCAAGQPWYRASMGPMLQPRADAAAQQQRSPLDVAYRLSCYPDTTDPNAAEAVEVGAGDRVAANLTLHAVPAVHISVEIPITPGGGRGGMVFPMFAQDVFGTPEMMQPGPLTIVGGQDGDESSERTVEMSVAPGEYEVQVATPDGKMGAFTTMNVTADNASLDLGSMPAMAEVRGTVSMSGGLPSEVSIALRPEQGIGNVSAEVKQDGSFEIASVRPGRYRLLLNTSGSGSGAYLFAAEMSASGGKAEGRDVEVGSDAVTLTVVAAEANTTVSGFAARGGKAARGVFVVLVPEGARASGAASDQAGDGEDDDGSGGALRADQTDSDGSFVWNHVLPGAYTLVAVEDGWTLDWAQPGAMARYLAKGEKVTVPPDAKSIDVKEPVEVQAK